MLKNNRQRSKNGKRTRRNKNKNKQTNKKAKVQYAKSIIPTTNFHLTGCAKDYISCLSNPFRNISPLPCIPDLISLPSNKFQVRVMSSVITNAAGQAQVGVFPFNSVVNDRVCIYGNTNAWVPVGSNSFEFNSALVGVTTSFSNSPYNVALFNNRYIQARLVGLGVKVRYAGTELNRGGNIILYRSPANIPIITGDTAQLLTYPGSRRVAMDRKFYSIAYVPDDPDFLGYQELSNLNGGAANALNPGASLVCVIEGAQPKQTFEIEMVGYWEMIGSLIGSSNTTFTKSHSDLVGLAAAMSALPTKISKKSPEAQESSMIGKAGQYLLTGTSYALGAVVPSAVGAVVKAGIGMYNENQRRIAFDSPD